MARIIVDCTHTFQTGAGTGIQRVVRRFADSLLAIAVESGFEVVPVRLEGAILVALPVVEGRGAFPSAGIRGSLAPDPSRSRFETAHLWVSRAGRLLGSTRLREWADASPNEAGLARWLAGRDGARAGGAAIAPRAGDIFVSLDSSWVYDIRTALDALGRAGATRVVFIHDVLPVTHPQWFTPGTDRCFRGWIEALLPRTDGFVTNSRTSCAEFSAVAEGLGHAPPPCRAVHLGAELAVAGEGAVRPALAGALAPGRPPAFLTVGTIEPRKNVGFAIDLFDELDTRGLDFQWHVVGSPGWLADDVARRIRGHRAYGKRLHWWVGLGDAELDWCYRHAAALVAVSSAEGFGLPLVEARLRELPVFASDIPVFREVLGAEGTSLPLSSARLAAAALEDFLAGLGGQGRRPSPSRIARPWVDSARELVAALVEIDARRRGPG